MRTMHPVLKRGGLFWDRDLLPERAYSERLGKLRAAISEAGDAAWLVYGDVERYGDLAYVSNFLPRTRSGLALVPAEGPPILLIHVGARDVPALKTLTFIEDVRPFSQLAKATLSALAERRLMEARIGLVGVQENLSTGDWREIEHGAPGVSWTRRTNVVGSMREAKDSWEIEAMRRAGSSLRDALDGLPETLSAGVSARRIAAEVDRRLRRSAAEDVRILTACGPQAGLSLRPHDEASLRESGEFMIFAAVEIQRYWAQAARTFALGRPPEGLRKMAEAANSALEAMRKACAPGVSGDELFQCAQEPLEAAGLASSARIYGHGQGIGLDREETPIIAAGAEARLRIGSTLALRVVAHEGMLGVSFGETVAIGESGFESLTGRTELTLV